jgi:hypothetical protein
MTKPRILARDQIRIVAALLQIPEPFVRQVSVRMKTDGRLPATRPIATDVTPQSLARLILGLCAPIPSKSTELEKSLGLLNRTSGDGAATAERDLENLIFEAASDADGEINFLKGDLLVGTTAPAVLITIEKYDGASSVRTYRDRTGEDDRLTRYVRIPLQTLRMLSLELLGD